jgi:hypothetical protein
MALHRSSRGSPLRGWLIWTAGFLAFRSPAWPALRWSDGSTARSPRWSGGAVDRQFTVLGAYGAVTFSALSGVLLMLLLPDRLLAGSPGEPAPAEARA